MTPQEQYIALKDIPDGVKLSVSEMIPVKSKIKIGSFLFEAASVNDSKQTVVFKLAGFFPPDQPPEPSLN